MTSRWRGGEGGCQNVTNSTDRLRECVTKGGRGSRNVKKLRDVIYGWSQREETGNEVERKRKPGAAPNNKGREGKAMMDYFSLAHSLGLPWRI